MSGTSHFLILAGGLGTRLADAANGLPKPMIPVAGRPFLTHILDRLPEQSDITLCVGYKYGLVVDFFGSSYKGRKIGYSVEDSPLGTGGAVLKALRGIDKENVCVINGDTIFDAPLDEFMCSHTASGADVTIALKPMSGFDRYGTVTISDDHRITSFAEKKHTEYGLVNGGLYMLSIPTILSLGFPEIFSLEEDFFAKYFQKLDMRGICYDSFFIDIGIPGDLAEANRLLS